MVPLLDAASMVDEVAYRELISGRRRGPGASLQRWGLSFAAVGFGVGSRLNGWLYDLGLKSVGRVDVPVVSIGNVTAGGTGKTPVVAHVVNLLRRLGRRPGIVSRGYRSSADGVNDEKRLLDLHCRGVPHLQDRDRLSAARTLVAERDVDVLVLDDGFQHRRLHRDLDIVLVDALEPWGYGRMLPRGLLREPVSTLRRADLVVITRADQCEPAALERTRAEIREVTTAPVLEATFPPKLLVNVAGTTATLDSIRDAPAVAFCGIGNPLAFRGLLDRLGVRLLAFEEFPDHHDYREADLARLRSLAEEHDAPLVLCTEKDLVKLREENLGDAPLWAVRIGVGFPAGEERLEQSLTELVPQSSPDDVASRAVG